MRRVIDEEAGLDFPDERASPAFVAWRLDSHRIVFGFGGWAGDHERLPGPAWLVDLRERSFNSLGDAVSQAAFIDWPR